MKNNKYEIEYRSFSGVSYRLISAASKAKARYKFESRVRGGVRILNITTIQEAI